MKEETKAKLISLAFVFVLIALIWAACRKEMQEISEICKVEPEETIEIKTIPIAVFEEQIVPDAEETEKVEEPEAAEAEEIDEIACLGEFKLTAYCSCEKCCGEWAEQRPKDAKGKPIVLGSTGEVLEAGKSIAVDPDVIPYGTEVIINGHTYKAQDCGGAIKENHIDVYFDDHQEALEFGIQYADVFIEGVNSNVFYG